jgi:hypothetical protein
MIERVVIWCSCVAAGNVAAWHGAAGFDVERAGSAWRSSSPRW